MWQIILSSSSCDVWPWPNFVLSGGSVTHDGQIDQYCTVNLWIRIFYTWPSRLKLPGSGSGPVRALFWRTWTWTWLTMFCVAEPEPEPWFTGEPVPWGPVQVWTGSEPLSAQKVEIATIWVQNIVIFGCTTQPAWKTWCVRQAASSLNNKAFVIVGILGGSGIIVGWELIILLVI